MSNLYLQHISILDTFQVLSGHTWLMAPTWNSTALHLSLLGRTEHTKQKPLEGSQLTTLVGNDRLLRQISGLYWVPEPETKYNSFCNYLEVLVIDLWNKQKNVFKSWDEEDILPSAQSSGGNERTWGTSSELQKHFTVQLCAIKALRQWGAPGSVLQTGKKHIWGSSSSIICLQKINGASLRKGRVWSSH